MNADCMSPAELRALADKKEKESKVVKIGYAKENIYSFDFDRVNFDLKYIVLTATAADNYIKHIHKSLSQAMRLIIPAETKFYAYKISDTLIWYDGINYGFEFNDSDSHKYLHNIRKCN